MSALGGKRILVVEDEPIIAMALQDLLEEFGCVAVGPAYRLDEGLDLSRSAELDGAVLDINLAGERSYAIADLLRARGIPHLFATGYGAAEREGERATAAPVIQKPYRRDQLEAALLAVLPR